MRRFPSTITIDGPAGAGKSTVGELLAKRLDYLYFDTGTMYRALTWATLHQQIDPHNGAAVAALAHATDIDVQPPTVADGRQYTVLVNQHDVTWELRSPEVERAVSLVARYPEVRAVMRARQREIGLRGSVVMVGRDIGSIVMYDAPLKIYLEASLDERARRRAAELARRGQEADFDTIRADMARRDELDQHVMAAAEDAVVVQSDSLTPDEVVTEILHLAEHVVH